MQDTGIVIKSTGSWYQVLTDAGEVMQCRTVGKLRLTSMGLTNPIAVGDRVEFTLEMGEQKDIGFITGICERKNYVLRASPRSKKEIHMIAANLDQALLVTTIIEPMLKPGFIDRYLLTTETHRIPVIIVFNKCDLYGKHAKELYNEMAGIYTKIGYTVITTSSETGEGIEALRGLLKDKTTLITGQSGVGKSTLVNALQPGMELRTGELSDRSGKGTHTTTFAEMFLFKFGGRIIDTPGIKALSFNHIEPEHVAHNYREMFALSSLCRFGASCMHVNEPNCAVKVAVETEEISGQRYDSYLSLLKEVQEQKYWERKKLF